MLMTVLIGLFGTTGLRICFRNNRIKKQIHQFWNNRIRNHFHEIGNNRIKNQIHRFGTTWLRFSWDFGTTGLRNKFTDFGTTGLRTIFTWGFGTRLRSTWPTRFGTTGLNVFERQRALSVLVKSSHCARGESEGSFYEWQMALPALVKCCIQCLTSVDCTGSVMRLSEQPDWRRSRNRKW